MLVPNGETRSSEGDVDAAVPCIKRLIELVCGVVGVRDSGEILSSARPKNRADLGGTAGGMSSWVRSLLREAFLTATRCGAEAVFCAGGRDKDEAFGEIACEEFDLCRKAGVFEGDFLPLHSPPSGLATMRSVLTPKQFCR